MRTKPLSTKLSNYLVRHQLTQKFNKQISIFKSDPHHPSLNTELLEPKSARIYSFRIDQKYRAIFIIVHSEVEIIDINDHYQ